MSPASLSDSRVSEVMRHGVLTCQPETPLEVVARMMSEHRVHSVVVSNLDGVSESAWGIVSDVDVLRAAPEGGRDRAAGEIAGTELLTVAPDETLEHAAQLMAEHEITHLVVVSGDKPVGVISSLDVAAWMAYA
ncbi:MAG TPA: CBS domain-containing protein [Solirubrobacterales bacterium]|jgi:CBS domain-containing protein|nr:CBS domain-containing protein [Solirubrobacterales bacterium]